ncbi:unnamed protein product [Acanthosepion pharaonis]|uniref:Uncharacterized protein n=1 Tax=Acanthosepion pharaonis TaxID=158019 RepID=A0A812CE31_ACAPH|nr:unnamed protein product [Sepia pharaonis]
MKCPSVSFSLFSNYSYTLFILHFFSLKSPSPYHSFRLFSSCFSPSSTILKSPSSFDSSILATLPAIFTLVRYQNSLSLSLSLYLSIYLSISLSVFFFCPLLHFHSCCVSNLHPPPLPRFSCFCFGTLSSFVLVISLLVLLLQLSLTHALSQINHHSHSFPPCLSHSFPLSLPPGVSYCSSPLNPFLSFLHPLSR